MPDCWATAIDGALTATIRPGSKHRYLHLCRLLAPLLDVVKSSMSLLLASILSSAIAGAPSIETTKIPAPDRDGEIALHCISPKVKTGKSVLFIHGSTFPTKTAFGFEFKPGDSWMTFMADRGYLACGLDFSGFGESSFPQEMHESSSAHPPILRASQAADEIATAVNYMQSMKGAMDIHIVAHSWGTIPAATFAARHPHDIKSLTLFGPVVPSGDSSLGGASNDAWFYLTAQERLDQLRFKAVLPPGKNLLEPSVESSWAEKFRASTPRIEHDAADQIRIPNGPNVDVDEAISGKYPYLPKDITVPIFVVYGNYDVVVNDSEASSFLSSFTSSPMKWKLQISDGSHVMHLERERWSLYESVAAFIRATSEVAP